MTSSLVGSEMCIRDSSRVAPSQLGHEGLGPPRRSTRATEAQTSAPGRGSVSYTHLTLPTICSV
eukprot:7399354-Prorocentrum_lima.AAC.1